MSKVEIFLKVNSILKEMNEIGFGSKQEDDVSQLTENSLDVSRAFAADLSMDDFQEKSIPNLLFTPLSKYLYFFYEFNYFLLNK